MHAKNGADRKVKKGDDKEKNFVNVFCFLKKDLLPIEDINLLNKLTWNWVKLS